MSGTGSSRRNRVRGFTLFELLLVIFLLGLFAALASVRVENLLPGGDLRLATRTIIKEIRAHRGRAAYTRTLQVLGVDMEHSRLRPFDSEAAQGEDASRRPEAQRTLPAIQNLPQGVRIEDVVLPSEGKIQEGETGIRFFANGCVERAVIHLRNETGEAYTLEINPITGHVEVLDGYIEKQTRPSRF